MGHTITACIPTRNDIESLRCTLPYTKRWADEIVVVDGGSTDGTVEYLKWFLEPKDKFIQLGNDQAIDHGCDEPRNVAAQAATSEWILALESDCFVKPEDIDALRRETDSTPDYVLRIKRLNIQAGSFTIFQLEAALMNTDCDVEWQDILYRRISGCQFRGYAHEELYRGEERAVGRVVDISAYHLCLISPSASAAEQFWRSLYRVKRMVENPELRKYVNPHWYGNYYQQNAEIIDKMAASYAKLHGL